MPTIPSLDRTLTHPPQHSRAWATRSYPCVGQWAYLEPKIAKSAAFKTVIDRLHQGGIMLDLGCCMGQELRSIAAAGAPTHNMYGADIEPVFWDLGYELFNDRDKFHAHFLHADIFDDESPLRQLHGCTDVIYLGSLLHLWDWAGQSKALVAIIKLAKAGSIVIGAQLGRRKGQAETAGWKNSTRTMFYHDPDTMEAIWRQAAAETATEWEVSARTSSLQRLHANDRDSSWMSKDAQILFFEATMK